MADILEHIARFKLARGLENKASAEAFQRSFDIHVLSKEKRFGPEDPIEVNDGAMVELIVRNRGVHDLYISIYNLGPCWQVENIYRVTYTVITPERECLGGGFQEAPKNANPTRTEGEGIPLVRGYHQGFCYVSSDVFRLLGAAETGRIGQSKQD
jgi:hypothetical protein